MPKTIVYQSMRLSFYQGIVGSESLCISLRVKADRHLDYM